jgi:hypothetical protein
VRRRPALGVGDIAISSVTVDRIEDLGNGTVRYHYNDSDALPGRNVDVVLVLVELLTARERQPRKTQSCAHPLPPCPASRDMTGWKDH